VSETTNVVNNSAKVIHVAGVMLVPGMPNDIPTEALENEQVKMLLELPVEPGSSKMALETLTPPEVIDPPPERARENADSERSVQASNPTASYASHSATGGDAAGKSSEASAASKPAVHSAQNRPAR
jgi:hypothetical protein